MPSILNLPSLHDLEGPDPSSSSSSTRAPSALRNRGNGSLAPAAAAEDDPLGKVKRAKRDAAAEEYAGVKKQAVHDKGENDGMRKDADVLTKVFVVRSALVRCS